MKVKILLLSIIFLFMCLNLISPNTDEDFFDFLNRFSFDKDFQIKRIKFPLEKNILTDDFASEIKKSLTIKEWEYVNLLGEKSSYFTDLQYSFKEENEKLPERIFAFIGIENGINIKYYFKKFDGIWYMIRVDDFSS
jgi:hypothetical protein